MLLRRVRVVLAVVMLGLITFFLVDFAELAPGLGALMRIQFVPAFFAHSMGILGALLLLTFLFGRVYCSVICPLGIWQDVLEWLAKRGKKKKRFRYAYRKPNRVLRYSILGVVVLALVINMTVVVGILDPYSMYARISVNLFKPLYLWMNNLLAGVLTSFDSYALYVLEVTIRSVISFVVALVSLLVVSWLAFRYGRLYCNTICPVGTVLGFVSRYSLVKIHIDKDACTSCKLCEKRCKASCIDSTNKEVDASRCVACFNCVGDTCKQNAISYRYVGRRKKKKQTAEELAAATPAAKPVNEGRRAFFTATGAVASTALLAKAQKATAHRRGRSYKKKHPISPPGSIAAEHLLHHCTSCHLCVSRCPTNVLKPAFMEYGIGGIMQPRMDFEKGFCNFDCTICADVCPNKALKPITVEEKHKLQVGRVVFVKKNCIPYTDGTSCGACSEHCPTQAVSMKPYKDGLTLPSIDPDICVGCGGCEFICPVRPYRAIYVEGNPIHLEAKPFEEAEVIEDTDFGFGF